MPLNRSIFFYYIFWDLILFSSIIDYRLIEEFMDYLEINTIYKIIIFKF